MAGNYYALLGIHPGATQAEIKSAYRRKAKELHPDTCGGDRELFQAAQEAYEVLSDPARRRAYDARAARARRPGVAPLWRQMSAERRVESLRSTSSPVEPLIPDTPTGREWGWESPWSFLFQEHPSPLWSDWDDLIEQIYLEVSLTPEQARHGGRVEVRMPLQITCPECRGQGGRGFSMCSRCAGRGRIADERPLLVSFPGNIVDGDIARLSLDRAGIPDVVLTVRFIVDDW